MYSNRFVVAVKVNSQILRENGETVALPFGSEYSIFLKNLNTLRSQVKVSVNGQDATEGTSLIVDGNSSLDLERFIRGGNMTGGNKFKFIERSEAVESHRGIQADDGLVRVEFQFERPKPEVIERIVREERQVWPTHPQYPWTRPPYPYNLRRPMHSSAPRASTGTGPVRASGGSPIRSRSMGAQRSAPSAAAGITVPGSHSQQRFHSVSGFQLQEQKYVIVLKLVGCVKGAIIVNAVTVDRKPECSTCGKSNKGDAQFCSQCGTGLILV